MRPALAARLAELLAEVSAQIVRLDVRDSLRIERLLASQAGGRWHRAELRAALASLLARNDQEWDAIAACFDRRLLAASADQDEMLVLTIHVDHTPVRAVLETSLARVERASLGRETTGQQPRSTRAAPGFMQVGIRIGASPRRHLVYILEQPPEWS